MIGRRRVRTADQRVLRGTTLRIALQSAAGVAVTVVTLAAVAVLVVLHSQHAADDDTIASAIARGDTDDPPVGVWVVVEREGGARTSTPGMPHGLPDEQALATVVRTRVATMTDFVANNLEYRVETQPLAGGKTIQVLLDLGADHVERDRLLEALLLSGLAGLVVAGLVGVWLSRRVMAPMAGALALQRRFVADAGHELRTPLTLLSTRAQLIQRAVRSDAPMGEVRSDVDVLVSETHNLTDILNDLLLAADPRETAAAERVDLGAVVRDAVESARPLGLEDGITLEFACPRQVAVAGSPAGLRRAVIALLDNAIRHAKQQVVVSVAVEGREVVVDVTDDGSGIDPEVARGLFDRFATTRTADAGKGPRHYGLGLALVNEIASRHGGSIAVRSTSSQGATFRLSLPVER